MKATLREATIEDLIAINSIYNHYVLGSTCTYDYEPMTLDERVAWFRSHDAEHPVTVATLGGAIVGWGSLSWFRNRIGYRFTVENAVYVHYDYHRRGIGRLLLEDLIGRAASLGHHAIIAGISAEQEASVALHRTAGFVEAGVMRRIGFKFDQWLDVVFMQRTLP